jgi:predicted ester cyclase
MGKCRVHPAAGSPGDRVWAIWQVGRPALRAPTTQEGSSVANTSVEQNKAVSRRWIDVFNARDDAAEADVRAPDYVAHAPASLEPAPLNSETCRFLAGFVEGFPDLRLAVEDAVGEGDLFAERVHFEGTHTGVFQGLPPTHKTVSFSGLELNRFADGKVVEHWFQLDALGLLQQLGLTVVPGPRLPPRILAHQLHKLRGKR